MHPPASTPLEAPPPKNSLPAWLLPAACFILWAIIIAVVAISHGINPQRNSVYDPCFVTAGYHWRNAENLYASVADFRYSPLIAAWFALLSFLPLRIGQYLWMAANLAGLFAGLAAWLKFAVPQPFPPAARWTLILLATPFMIGSVNNLQANPLMLGLMLLAVAFTLQKRWTLAAAAIALAAALKIYPLALGLILIVQFPKPLAWRIALALLIVALLPFAFQKPAYVAQSYHQWLSVLSQDNRVENGLAGQSTPPALPAALPATTQPHQPAMYRDAGMLYARWIGPVNPQIYRGLQLLSILAVGLIALLARAWKYDLRTRLAILLNLLLLWILLLGPSTESATYILAAPVVAWLIITSLHPRPLPAPLAAALLAYLLLLLAIMGAWTHFDRTTSPALQPLAALILLPSLTLWSLARRQTLPPETK